MSDPIAHWHTEHVNFATLLDLLGQLPLLFDKSLLQLFQVLCQTVSCSNFRMALSAKR